jgi:hypothetical protein
MVMGIEPLKNTAQLIGGNVQSTTYLKSLRT